MSCYITELSIITTRAELCPAAISITGSGQAISGWGSTPSGRRSHVALPSSHQHRLALGEERESGRENCRARMIPARRAPIHGWGSTSPGPQGSRDDSPRRKTATSRLIFALVSDVPGPSGLSLDKHLRRDYRRTPRRAPLERIRGDGHNDRPLHLILSDLTIA